jgi:hypothetical protein
VLAIAAFFCFASAATAAAPNTRITAGPKGLTTPSVTFRFTASGRGAKFQCRLDAGRFFACRSPRSYSRLANGLHTFRVRAVKKGVADRTPATRKFTVDASVPDTTIQSGPAWLGPDRVTEDHQPVFTFTSSEPDSKFECRLTTASFVPCTSPFTPASPLPDASYTFRVRARDKAGNADPSPATFKFQVNVFLKHDLATAQEAAALYFPDTLDLDVLPFCGGSPAVDCPGGTPWPAGAQLRITSARSVVEVPSPFAPFRYDVTVTQDVQTLAPIKINVPLAGDCGLAMTSASGATPTWRVGLSLSFIFDATYGDLRLARGDVTVSGTEAADYALSGNIGCQLFNPGSGYLDGLYPDILRSYFQQVAWKFCAAPGPAYLGPCPPPPGG